MNVRFPICTVAVVALTLPYKMSSCREFGVSFSNNSLCEIGVISVLLNKGEISYNFKIENVSCSTLLHLRSNYRLLPEE